jgi:hypothetical protein
MVNRGHTQLHIVPISSFVTLRGFRVRGIDRQKENGNRDVGLRIYVGEDQANDCPARLLCDTALRAGHDGIEENRKEGRERCHHSGAGTPTYDQRMP